MRGLPLALLLLGVAPLAAQSPVPDTTDWREYFLLEVGNEWQYRRLEQLQGGGLGVVLRGWRVEGDTTAAGVDYFVLRSCAFEEGQPVSCPERVLVRYAPAHAMLVTRDPFSGEDRWWGEIPCGLDAPFDALQVECTGPGTENALFFTYGGYDQAVVIPPDTLRRVTVKGFSALGTSGYSLTAGVGLTEYDDEFAPGSRRLIYARVGGREIGNPAFAFPTAAEASPSPTELDLAFEVIPNPAHGRAALTFVLPAPTEIAVALFDPLGRHVGATAPTLLGSGEHRIELDLSALAPGVYVARVTVGTRVASRKITVR